VVSQLKVNEIIKQSGSSITIGESGDTVSGPFTNVPAFEAYLGSSTTLSDNTQTKLPANTETYDTNSCYDTSTYKFTPTVAGKYLCYGQVNIQGGTINTIAQIYLRKNGSTVKMSIDRYAGDGDIIAQVETVIDLNGSSDYLEAYVRQTTGGSKSAFDTNSFFGAYRIIGA
jgi:hypothetical protein